MYAVKIENGHAVEAIVGDPVWATDRLGGEWVAYTEKIGIGWIWDGHQFTPPSEPELPA